MLRAALSLAAAALVPVRGDEAAAAPAAAADPAALLTCHACVAGVTELLKAVPALRKPTLKPRDEEDKLMALADAMPSFCNTGNFHGYGSDVAALSKSCAAFVKAAGAPLEAALVAQGAAPQSVCAEACAAVPEAQREPKAGEPAAGGGGAAKPKKKGDGTVNDPAYKAALKKKAARDAKRARDAAAAGGADSDEAPPAAEQAPTPVPKAKKKPAKKAAPAAPAAGGEATADL
jgi:hypothetical protein